MNYPLISEYVQAIKLSEENLDKLTNLRPVFDVDGNPIMSSGNFAVVFKMQDKQTGKLYAVKCFLREQEGREESYKLIASELEYVPSGFLVSVKYLEKELFVDTTQGYDTEFPVLLMDWVEGLTLDKYIRNNIHDQYKLALIAYQFCRMASWLLSQEFAHGDLKPDNIIVREDGQLVLVDYDGMFVPAMKGQKARELGSVDYRHPLRAEDKFDSTIDDFSIASIALSLKAISLKPELLNDFGAEDRLLLSAKDYHNISGSECMKAIQFLSMDTELSQLLGVFYIAYARNELSNLSYKLFNLVKPKFVQNNTYRIDFLCDISEKDLINAVIDEFGVKYSKDGSKLLRAPKNLVYYKVKEGTRIICNNAFSFVTSLIKIIIPNSVVNIGNRSFINCSSLSEVYIPDSVTYIGNFSFSNCTSLTKIFIPKSVNYIGRGVFCNCNLSEIVINNLRYCTIDGCLLIDNFNKELISCYKNIEKLNISNSIYSICDEAFAFCRSLREIVIPDSVIKIGARAFTSCLFLRKVVVSNSITVIREGTFSSCVSLYDVNIPTSVLRIETGSFYMCKSLLNIVIPDSVTEIGNFVFRGCDSLHEIVIPNTVNNIGNGVFIECKSLSKVVLPSFLKIINHATFYKCVSLSDIFIPDSVKEIAKSAFAYCESLSKINIPQKVESIGDGVFRGCDSLNVFTLSSKFSIIDNCMLIDRTNKKLISGFGNRRKIVIPDTIEHIASLAFGGYKSLCEIVIPKSITRIGDGVFRECDALRVFTDNSIFVVYDDCLLVDRENNRLISYFGNKKEVRIPDTVFSIGILSFGGRSLNKVVISESVKSIDDGAFIGCDSLQKVIVPNSVSYIGKEIFRDCNALKSILVPSKTIIKFSKLFKGSKCNLSIIKEQDE